MASASPSLLTTLLILTAVLLAFLAPSSFADSVLNSGETLNGGLSLSNGKYIFTMQTDCNLVLYDSGRAVWASGTKGKGNNCEIRMQTDGNLVIYGGGNRAVWASNTNRAQGSYRLVLQSDRNVVIYDRNNRAIWAIGTNRAGTAGVIISGNSTESAVVAGDKTATVNGNGK